MEEVGRRRKRWFRSIAVVAGISLSVIGLPAVHATAATASSPITYVYDSLGRLEAAIDPGNASTGLARYTYDAVGNLTKIQRLSTNTVRIVDFHPAHAAIGASITIYGAGFNSTIANDIVKFTKTNGSHGSSGQPATVTAATTTSLTVTVPSGIKSGSVYVKNQSTGSTDEIGDTAGEKSFILDGTLTPTISSVSPSSAANGATVTITGTGFVSGDPASNNVTINQTRAQVTSATATQLQAVVPPIVSSGAVAVRTPEGGVTGPDLYVPEDSLVVTGYTKMVRVSSGSTTSATVTTVGQAAVLIIGATRGQRIGVKASSITGASSSNHARVMVIDPMGRQFNETLSIDGTPSEVERMAVDAHIDGDYAVVVWKESGSSAVSLSLKVAASDPASGGNISVGGTASMNISQLGQEGTFTITGTQGQDLYFDLAGFAGGYENTVSLFQPSFPDGGPVGDGIVETSQGPACDGDFSIQIPETGKYRYVYTPDSSDTDPGGTATVHVTSGSSCQLRSARDASPVGPEVDPTIDLREATGAAAVMEGQGEAWAPDPAHLDRWTTGRDPSPLEHAPLPMADGGVTALAGRLLRLNGAPLVGATLRLGRRTAVSDDSGAFLLERVRPRDDVLTIDGTTASTDDRSYGSFQVHVEVKRHQTSTLGYVAWMPVLDSANERRVAFPTNKEIVLTTSSMPGFEVHIPAGARITDANGNPVHRIGITPVPLDRTPFPMPFNGFAMHFTLQPGWAHVDTGFQVVYPNYFGLPARYKVPVYNYETDEGWEQYGSARVSGDGEQILPRASARVYDFAGSSFAFLAATFFDATCIDEEADPANGCMGDPVDVTNGIWRYAKTDLVEPGPMPIQLTRIYRQNDGYPTHSFGIATELSLEMSLTSLDNTNYIDLMIPGGRRVHFTPINGAGSGTPMKASAGQGRFAGATLDLANLDYVDGPHGSYVVRLVDGTRYTFYGLHQLLREIRDRFGNALILTYNDDYQPTGLTSYPSGRWISFTYSTNSTNKHIVSASDQSGRTVAYTYENPTGFIYRLKTITSADQQGLPSPASTTLGWDPSTVINANPSPLDSPGTHLTSITDPRGNQAMQVHYDATGRVDQQTLANGGVWTYGYDLASDPVCQGSGKTKVTDPNGNITCATYSNNYIDSVTRAAGTSQARTTTYTRDNQTKKTTSIVDTILNPGPGDPATNRTTTLGNDSNEMVSSITRLSGTGQAATTSFGYAMPYGQLTLIDKPLNDDIHFSYTDGCLTRVEDDLGHGRTMTCTSSGLTKTVTDDLGNQITLNYVRGDLIKTIDGLSRATSRFVDAGGRLSYVTDPLGYRTKIGYDALNRPTKVTDTNGQTTTIVYDANGNMTDLTQDATGGHIAWAYDNIDRVQTRTDQLGRVETYTYDANGNVKTWQNRRGHTQRYCYDPFNRITFVGYDGPDSGALCNSAYASSTSYTWDNGGRLHQVDDSIAGTITRDYDDLDRLTSETTPQGQVAYTWDDSSRRATMTVQGQTQIVYDYFQSDLPKTITQGSVQIGYTYDSANRLDKLTLANGIVQDYTFDASNQVTKISYDKGATNYGAINYGYDGDGRRSGVWGSWGRTNLPAATTADATYNVQNQLTGWNGTSIGYDLDGNMSSYGANTYSWDARGQLTGTSQGSISYGYDGVGRRISRTAAGATQKFLYDGLQMVQEQDGAGGVTANTISGQGLDQPLRRVETAGTTRNYLTDALGSVIALADGAATNPPPTSYTYEPYGTQTLSGTASSNPFGFTGREFDASNSVQFNRLRYMSPTFGRFVSEDPIDVFGGLNLYGYAIDAPTLFIDPLGLDIDFFEWVVITLDSLALTLTLSGLVLGTGGLGLGLVVAGTATGWYGFYVSAVTGATGEENVFGLSTNTVGTLGTPGFAPIPDVLQLWWDIRSATSD